MTRRGRPTDDAVHVVKGITGTHKLIASIVFTLAALYAGITFIVERALDRYERERQKIGRQEFKNYKAEAKERMDKLERDIDKLDERIDKLHP